MHTRSGGTPHRAMRALRCLPLFVFGLVLSPAAALASNYWHTTVPPESLLQWRPRSARQAASTPGRAPGQDRPLALPAALPATAGLTANDSAGWIPLGELGTRFHHDSALDAATRRVVVFGGWGDPSSPGVPDLVVAGELGGPASWEALGTASLEAPRARFASAVTIDPVHHALLVFGGQAADGTGDLLGDLWSLSLEPGGTWTRLAPAGPAPEARRYASLFFDAPRARFVLAGGYGASALPEFWELRLDASPAWRPLVFSNAVAANLGAVLADPIRGDAWSVAWENEIHRLVIGSDVVTADTALAVEPDPSRWGAPSLMLAGLDPVERRLLWFGYQSGGPTFAYMDQLRWFSLDESHELSPLAVGGPAPANRLLFASSWDPDGRRLVVTGGYDDELTYFGDAWQLAVQASLPTAVAASLRLAESDARGVRLAWHVTDAAGEPARIQRSGDGAAWTDVGAAVWSASDELSFEGPPLAAGEHAAFRLVLSPGANETRTAPVWVDGPARTSLALAARRSPAGPDLAVTFSLAPDLPARLRVLDAAGRLVAEAHVPAGTREWSFGRAAAPGLYFAELTQGGERRTAKLVTLR